VICQFELLYEFGRGLPSFSKKWCSQVKHSQNISRTSLVCSYWDFLNLIQSVRSCRTDCTVSMYGFEEVHKPRHESPSLCIACSRKGLLDSKSTECRLWISTFNLYTFCVRGAKVSSSGYLQNNCGILRNKIITNSRYTLHSKNNSSQRIIFESNRYV
jgi:hypothetical protein